MRRLSFVVLFGLVAGFWINPIGAIADEKKAEMTESTLEGRLIDLMCYTMGMIGDKHTKCALQCAQKGLPVGLLEAKTEKVYTVLLPSPGLASYVEKTVRITGKIHKEKLLAPSKMEVREGDIWKAVKLPSAM